MNKNPISPYLGLLLGIGAVSTASLFIRLAQGEAPSFVIAAGRLLIAALVLFPFAIGNLIKELKSQTTKNTYLLLLAGLFLGLHFASWITSLEYTTVPINHYTSLANHRVVSIPLFHAFVFRPCLPETL